MGPGAWSVWGLGSGESGAWRAAPPLIRFRRFLEGQKGSLPLSLMASSICQERSVPAPPCPRGQHGPMPSGQSQLASPTPRLQSTAPPFHKEVSRTRAIGLGGVWGGEGWALGAFLKPLCPPRHLGWAWRPGCPLPSGWLLTRSRMGPAARAPLASRFCTTKADARTLSFSLSASAGGGGTLPAEEAGMASSMGPDTEGVTNAGFPSWVPRGGGSIKSQQQTL